MFRGKSSGEMPDIEKIATECARSREQPYMEWLDALSEGRTLQQEAHLDDRAFGVLVEACVSPRQFSLMVEALDAHAKEHPGETSGFALLAGHADDSPYGLADWIAALEYAYDWLAESGRISPGLKPLLEYISCCVEAAASAPAGYPLTAMVEEMLDRYGMETQ